jgi:hypothetical protein
MSFIVILTPSTFFAKQKNTRKENSHTQFRPSFFANKCLPPLIKSSLTTVKIWDASHQRYRKWPDRPGRLIAQATLCFGYQ